MSLVVPFEEIFANETGLLAKHESWDRIELGDACKILNGFPFKSSLFNKSEGFPVIRIRDIATSLTKTFYAGDFPLEYVVTKGDLLIGMDGNFRCFEWLGSDAGLNQRVCKITADEKILHRQFLLYGLNGYLKAIQDVTSSVTVGHLSSRDVQRISFPIPPLASSSGLWRSWRRCWAKWTPASGGWRRFRACSNASANPLHPQLRGTGLACVRFPGKAHAAGRLRQNPERAFSRADHADEKARRIGFLSRGTEASV